MARPEKVAEVEVLTTLMTKSEGLVLCDFSGLTVAEANDLRGKCREQNVTLRVVKNRLAQRAATAAEYDSLNDLLKGPTAIAFGLEGPVEPAKVLTDYAKDNEKVTIKGGFVDGEVLSLEQVKALSDIPSHIELITMIARGINSPATGLAGSVSAVMSGLARAIKAAAEKNEEAAA